jgi:hypothetical protein
MMQYAGNAALAAALTPGQVRELKPQLLVDWNGDGLFTNTFSDLSGAVTDVQLSADVVGAYPQEITLMEGYSIAELVITVEGYRNPESLDLDRNGNPVDMVQLLSQYNSNSPLYGVRRQGASVQYSVLVTYPSGSQLIRKFTGVISDVVVSRAKQSVSITCYDPLSLIGGGLTTPLFAVDNINQAAASGNGSDLPMVNAAWCVDYILRQNGFYQGPAPHPNAVLAWTLAGSGVPEVGVPTYQGCTYSTTYTNVNQFALWNNGQYGLCADGTTYRCRFIADAASSVVVDSPGSSNYVVGIGFWVYMPTGSFTGSTPLVFTFDNPILNGSAPAYEIQVQTSSSSNAFVVDLIAPGYAHTATSPTLTTNSWHYVGVALSFSSTSVTYAWNIDGTITTGTLVSSAYPTVGTKTCHGNLQIISAGFMIQHVQVWYTKGVSLASTVWPMTPPTSGNYGANVTLGENFLYSVPDIINGDGLSTLKDIVDTELAALYCTEFGVPTFMARETVLNAISPTTAAGTLTIDSLQDITMTDSVSSVVNQITVEAQATLCVPGIGWQLSDLWSLPIGNNTTVTKTFTFDGSVGIQWGTVPYLGPSVPTDLTGITSGFFCVFYTTGAACTSGVTVTVIDVSSRTFTLQIVNTNGDSIWFALPATGSDPLTQPCLIIGGAPLTNYQEATNIVSNTGSESVYRTKTLDFGLSQWRQNVGTQTSIAQGLLSDLSLVTPVMSDIPMPSDPRIELLDSFEVNDPGETGSNYLVSVFGFTHTFSVSQGMADTLKLKLRYPPGVWVLGIPEYSELGITTRLVI